MERRENLGEAAKGDILRPGREEKSECPKGERDLHKAEKGQPEEEISSNEVWLRSKLRH